LTLYALSFHADYRCQHAGACCTSDWDVPVEVPLYRTLAEALTTERLAPAAEPAEGDPVLLTGPDLPKGAAAIVATTAGGNCVFYHRSSGLCVIHRDAGEERMPSTCRHFPRLALRDGRGTFISLTHYCPTAAAMLFRNDAPSEIVEGPAAFPPAEYDGLVVPSDEWPPLLHPQKLMDADGYAAWERHMVARCADEVASPESVIATLERDARLLRQYRPGNGSLAEAVARLPEPGVGAQPPATIAASLDRHREAVGAVPDGLEPRPDEGGLPEAYVDRVLPEWAVWDRPLKRYLAAKAFASWTAYQGRGVLTIVRGLDAALALVRVEAARRRGDAGRRLDADLLCEAFRQADFILNHVAVGEDLAAAWSHVEHGDDRSVIARPELALDRT
jgi:Fe-S-cluster containining protein